MNLLQRLQQHFAVALGDLCPDPDTYLSMVRAAQDPKFGDYQANFAMSLGKTLGKPPRDVAQAVLSKSPPGDFVEKAEVAGPGFINIRIRSEWLAARLREMALDPRLGVEPTSAPRTIAIDFSSPNVAKPLHVGHLRSTIIGDCLTRLLRFLGHTVITDNHLGDWGTQFGMLLYGYKNFLDEAGLKADPVREMVRLYLQVRRLTKGEEEEGGGTTRTPEEQAHYDQCLAETAKLQAGDPENVALWKQFMPWSMGAITPLYDLLDVRFDHFHGESFYNPMLPSVVEDLLSKGIATTSRGAVVVFLKPAPEDGSEHRADAVIRKQDGAFTYMTSDLATVRYRMQEWKPHAILYVVGVPQSQHFSTLFEISRRWGYQDVAFEHIAFGSVLGNDRKMLSTRNGGAAELADLLSIAIERAAAQYEETRRQRLENGQDVPELSESEKRQIAEVVGIGAVKYADLSQNRTSDYVFSFDKMLAMEGNTATYMQYAYARNRSIFTKGEESPERYRKEPPLPSLARPEERALALQLLRFQEVLEAAVAEYKPNVLTNYLWDLSKAYSSFYQNCKVLEPDEGPSLRPGRLLLCDLTARVIQKGLDLLGIRTVERM